LPHPPSCNGFIVHLQLGIEEALKLYYKTKVLPVERHYAFEQFHGPSIADAEFDMKPTVMIVGLVLALICIIYATHFFLQYSTGKTTFVSYFLGRDYPGESSGYCSALGLR